VESGQADSRIRGGFDTALAEFEESRRQARGPLADVARDPRLGAALSRGDERAAERRMRSLVRGPVEAIELTDDTGRVIASAGSRSAVAHAMGAPVGPDGKRLGTLAVSTTDAPEYAGEIKRLTKLDAVVVRGGAQLASTLRGAKLDGDERDEVKVGDTTYRGRFQEIGQPPGEPLRLGMFGKTSELSGVEVSDRRLTVGGILLLAFLLAFFGSRIMVRALQGQIDQFLAAARRLGQGDFSHKVPTVGNDEFAALGSEFNSMSEQLKAQIEEVERKRRELEETIRRVGDAFAAGLDRKSSAELAVQTAVKACSADAGRITPIDRTKMEAVHAGSLEGRVDAALREAERETFRVRSEDRDELLAYLEGSPDGGQPVRLVRIEQDGVHALAYPLRARLTAASDVHYAGVISLARVAEPFTEPEVELFAYLAGQAAVSIENIDLHEAVQRQAVTDELTGLFNVRHFQETLDREIERSARFNYNIGLVMMDIDNFKGFNDTYGHQQGDLVLVEVARVLRSLSRDVDEPARYGGEEMSVILPQTDIAGAELQAERFRAAIESLTIPRLDGEGELSVTASFGVASLPGGAVEKEGFIAAADAALYRAKRAGKNRVERAEPTPASR
jgi:diguanylate cyclase (GGDEF)-like protein